MLFLVAHVLHCFLNYLTYFRFCLNSLKTGDIESKEAKNIVEKYLDVGEWVFDASVTFMGSSNYFERKR